MSKSARTNEPTSFSSVEKYFSNKDPFFDPTNPIRKIPVITVENYLILGQITALRFLEWVCSNPEGVIALPTGRTPEFFIKWVQFYLTNWEKETKDKTLEEVGLKKLPKPSLKGLTFFQLDEFFPIQPNHRRSFTQFVQKFYVEGFGLDPAKVNLINTFYLTEQQKGYLGGKVETVEDIFPSGVIDLSLRIRQPTTEIEHLQQQAIRMFDSFCADYEQRIRDLGGIGFFLGGIGPDGHIAFNVRGSSHFSHTRLTQLNYETQATAATDLGGIERVREKAVITIGLETITYNPNVVALITAAGESKSKVIADAAEKLASQEYPATALHKLPNSRLYVSKSAAIRLTHRPELVAKNYTPKESEIGDLHSRYLIASKLIDDTQNTPNVEYYKSRKQLVSEAAKLMKPELIDPVSLLKKSIQQKIEKGSRKLRDERFLHTAPHHDDIELAYFPYLHHLVRSRSNTHHFTYFTPGYTAVTDEYVQQCLTAALELFETNPLYEKPNWQEKTDSKLAQDDIVGYLKGIAHQNLEWQLRNLGFRIIRRLANYSNVFIADQLRAETRELLTLLINQKPTDAYPASLNKMKGWIREFEAELVWAHFGIGMEDVSHLNLGFYSDDIFPKYPSYEEDVKPIVDLMEKLKPTVITFALDPEGSGPDTHYKTLIALGEAIDIYAKKYPDVDLKLWGYRNVWSRWHLSDVDIIVPVSLNAFAVLHNMFDNCFISQKSASFPSYELNGTFSQLAHKVWVDQFEDLKTLVGQEHFYQSDDPMLRRAYGALYLKEMNYTEFQEQMKPVRALLEVKALMDEK